MRLLAEYVGRGHPDRIADSIVAEIVKVVSQRDSDALCGLECAVHTNKVFIDGRIASGIDKPVITHEEIEEIVREVYGWCGYSDTWYPSPKEIVIIQDICLELLSDEERAIRVYSDDQNIVAGYAINNESTNYLPVAHFFANRIGQRIDLYIKEHRLGDKYGTDYKVLVDIEKNVSGYSWNKLTLSIRHKENVSFSDIFFDWYKGINEILKDEFSIIFPSLSHIDNSHFLLNGAGDFVRGGPDGDNGLSGKKLVVDFYGPDVPIGGGAIFGKDAHKIDVCGPLRARQVAVDLIKKYNFYSVFLRLAWSPGESAPSSIEAYEIDNFGIKTTIDRNLIPPDDYFSIKCINKDMKLNSYDWKDKILKGIMF